MVLVHSGVIENYIERVTELSQSTQRLPNSGELAAIATELGIEPEEIEAAQQYAQDHYTRAQGFMQHQYWEDAITELQEAIALNPTQSEMLLCLAQAHFGRWQQYHQRQDAEQFHLRVRQCLANDPDSDAALELLAAFRNKQKRRSHLFLAVLTFVGSVVLGGAGYIFVQGGFPLVLEEKARIEELETRLGEQRREIADLQQTQETLEQELAQTRDELNRNFSRQASRVNELEQQIKQLEAQLRDLQYRLSRPILQPERPPLETPPDAQE